MMYTIYRKYRHTAYHHLVYWCWGWLERTIASHYIIVPHACGVNRGCGFPEISILLQLPLNLRLQSKWHSNTYGSPYSFAIHLLTHTLFSLRSFLLSF